MNRQRGTFSRPSPNTYQWQSSKRIENKAMAMEGYRRRKSTRTVRCKLFRQPLEETRAATAAYFMLTYVESTTTHI